MHTRNIFHGRMNFKTITDLYNCFLWSDSCFPAGKYSSLLEKQRKFSKSRTKNWKLSKLHSWTFLTCISGFCSSCKGQLDRLSWSFVYFRHQTWKSCRIYFDTSITDKLSCYAIVLLLVEHLAWFLFSRFIKTLNFLRNSFNVNWINTNRK